MHTHSNSRIIVWKVLTGTIVDAGLSIIGLSFFYNDEIAIAQLLTISLTGDHSLDNISLFYKIQY